MMWVTLGKHIQPKETTKQNYNMCVIILIMLNYFKK